MTTTLLCYHCVRNYSMRNPSVKSSCLCGVVAAFVSILVSGCFTTKPSDASADLISFYSDQTIHNDTFALNVSLDETNSVFFVNMRISAPGIECDVLAPAKWVEPFQSGFTCFGEEVSYTCCHFVFSVNSEDAKIRRWYGKVGDIDFEAEDSLYKYLNCYRSTKNEYRKDFLTKEGLFCCVFFDASGNLCGVEINRLKIGGECINMGHVMTIGMDITT